MDGAPGTSRHRYTDATAWQDTAGYSRAVRAGNRIAVSGTTSSAPDGSPAHPGDTYRQTLEAIHRGVQAVAALGGSVADVVRTRVLLVPGARWEDAARAHKEVFDAVRPANTMLFVAALIGDGLLVEVEIDAEVDAGVDAEVEAEVDAEVAPAGPVIGGRIGAVTGAAGPA